MTSSSTSLQQFLVPAQMGSRRRLAPSRQAVSKLAASSTAQEDVEVRADAGRLEPRVEEREGGYWVLMERFRAGINPQEKVKLEKLMLQYSRNSNPWITLPYGRKNDRKV